MLLLEREFHCSQYLTLQRRNEISNKIGFSEKKIKVWFQNRRMKYKKDNRANAYLNPTPHSNHQDQGGFDMHHLPNSSSYLEAGTNSSSQKSSSSAASAFQNSNLARGLSKPDVDEDSDIFDELPLEVLLTVDNDFKETEEMKAMYSKRKTETTYYAKAQAALISNYEGHFWRPWKSTAVVTTARGLPGSDEGNEAERSKFDEFRREADQELQVQSPSGGRSGKNCKIYNIL